MSSWKLVEAIPEEVGGAQKKDHSHSPNNDQGNRNNRSPNNGFKTGRGNGRGGRGRGRNQGPHLSKQDRNYLSHMAVQQIELIFTPDNLCMDTFIRSYMDEAGYVPLALVCNYQNVACYGAPYYDVLNLIQQTPTSKLEVDTTNETLRLKEGWEMWLMPNGFGGKGLPRYVKNADVNYENLQQQQQDQQQQYDENTIQEQPSESS